MEYGIVGAIVVLIIQFIGATMMASAAEDKGYRDKSAITLKCFFLGVFGYLYVLALPDLYSQEHEKIIIKKLEEIEKMSDDLAIIKRELKNVNSNGAL